ncbi:MAG: pyruvate kinase [Candidatus Gracilibacteria bacterium]|jgi:pyruvate kinase
MQLKKTKLVCTLGPKTDSVSEITKIIQAGMDVCRLNFSHGSYENHLKIIKNLRIAAKNLKKEISILQDLQGPKIRLGDFDKEGVNVKKGETFKLSITAKTNSVSSQKIIPIQYKNIIKDVRIGDILLINDGLIEVKVIKKLKDGILVKTTAGGILKPRNGINSPTATLSAKTITNKDLQDLKFGLKNNVDFVALSFVKSARDIKDLRKIISSYKKTTKIVAKIERKEAVKDLKSIIKEADAVMVARGDLGINMPPEQVPIIQKRMINLCNKYAKPVITATQVLQSMVENPTPTRAEISDAANAVFDHTDAIMLSNESAVGKYPFRATAMLTKVALTVEKEMEKDKELREFISSKNSLSSLNATCLSACELAKDLDANLIAVYTQDGFTARHVAKYRPYTPIIVITPNHQTKMELNLVWGLNRIYVEKINGKSEEKTKKIIALLKKENLVKKGQKIVIVSNASSQEKLISTIKI